MGWITWARLRPEAVEGSASHTPRKAIACVVAGLHGTALLTFVRTTFTDSSQLADASTTAVSLIAQYMLNRRWIEN